MKDVEFAENEHRRASLDRTVEGEDTGKDRLARYRRNGCMIDAVFESKKIPLYHEPN